MIYLSLEVAEAGPKTGRFDEHKIEEWVPIASSQSTSEEGAKALMLENVLEALNDESLLPFNQWLRLVHYGEDHKTITKVEVF